VVRGVGRQDPREIAEQQKIDEFGGIRNLLNKSNPIGQRRLDLMPQPYSRP
jgi:hypothetical protein